MLLALEICLTILALLSFMWALIVHGYVSLSL